MARWWRINELGGRFYPEYTLDGGKSWLREYSVSLKNGYATKRGAKDWAQVAIKNGDDWWDQPDTLSIFDKQALTDWFEAHGIDSQDTVSEEEVKFRNRAGFAKWLIEHGKLSEELV